MTCITHKKIQKPIKSTSGQNSKVEINYLVLNFCGSESLKDTPGLETIPWENHQPGLRYSTVSVVIKRAKKTKTQKTKT